MSIIATVYIAEGIAMAADSRLTGTTTYPDGTRDRHTLSDNSQKIFLIKNETVGISCCGDAIIAGKSVGDFIRLFEIEKVENLDSVTDVAMKLKEYTIENHGFGVIYHVCGYIDDKQYVYQITDAHLQLVNNNSIETLNYGAVWKGEVEVLHNLLISNRGIDLDLGMMQLKDGIDLAEFMVDVTCKTHRFQKGLGTCGGSIDVLVITKDYTKWIRHKVLNP